MRNRKQRSRTEERQKELEERRLRRKMRLNPNKFAKFTRPPQGRRMMDSDKIGPTIRESRYRDIDQRDKTLKLAELCRELMGIAEVDGVLQVQRPPDAKTIENLADHVVHMWPKDWRENTTESFDGLTLLYWGPQTPNVVANSVTRLSLYADRILVCNPFTRLLLHHPNHSPLIRPEIWWYEFPIYGLYLVLLEPWIRQGLVQLVQQPGAFDVKTFTTLSQRMKERIASNSTFQELIEKEVQQKDLLAELLLQHPQSDWGAALSIFPLTTSEHEQVLCRARSIAAADPIRANFHLEAGSRQSGLFGGQAGLGLSYEEASMICRNYNASLVASDEMSLAFMASDSLQFTQDSQRTAQLLNDLRLNFLNNVSVDFAMDMRASCMLSNFRGYLTSLTRGIQLVNNRGSFNDAARREFEDRFDAEFNRYSSDWRDLQNKLAMTATATAVASVGSAAATIATGNLSLLGICAAAVSPLANSLVSTAFERRKLERQPMNIAFRLEKANRARA